MGQRSFNRYLALLRIIFGNPLTRYMLRGLARDIDGRPALEKMLARYSGEQVDLPISCRIDSYILGVLMKTGSILFGADEEQAKEYLRDPAVRRGFTLIFKGLYMYGPTVPQRLPAPFLIVWNFTNMCNLRCMHCYQNAGKPSPDELTLDEKLRAVDMLDRAGVAAIAFSGGEPLIHPDFPTVAREASSRGIYIAVATNGIALSNYDYAKKIRRCGVRYLEISLDSPIPSEHDRFRGLDGAWEKTVRGIKNAVKAGFTTAVATTISKFNKDYVEDMVRLADELGVNKIIFFNFIPVGRGKDIIDLDLDPLEREEVIRELFRLNRKYSVEVLTTAPQYSRISLQLSSGREVSPTHFYVGGDPGIEALADFIGGCGAGRIYAALQPNGDVSPCVFMPIVVGNLRRDDFIKIWRETPLFNRLRDRDILKGFCGRCIYRYVCGGCRARAYSYYGDELEVDPGCIYNLHEWNRIKRRILRGIEVPA